MFHSSSNPTSNSLFNVFTDLISSQQTLQNQRTTSENTVFIGDLPLETSSIELYKSVKDILNVEKDFDIVLKRPQLKYFNFAFCRFTDYMDA